MVPSESRRFGNSTCFQKSNISWPLQPLTARVSLISKKQIFDDSFQKKGTSFDDFGARDDLYPWYVSMTMTLLFFFHFPDAGRKSNFILRLKLRKFDYHIILIISELLHEYALKIKRNEMFSTLIYALRNFKESYLLFLLTLKRQYQSFAFILFQSNHFLPPSHQPFGTRRPLRRPQWRPRQPP